AARPAERDAGVGPAGALGATAADLLPSDVCTGNPHRVGLAADRRALFRGGRGVEPGPRRRAAAGDLVWRRSNDGALRRVAFFMADAVGDADPRLAAPGDVGRCLAQQR